MLKVHFIKASVIILALLITQNSLAQPALTWCAYFNWAPWIYPAGKGYDGILIEQLTLFEKQHKIQTQTIDRKNWKRCQVDVTNGQIDMILGANKTPEREQNLAYLAKPAFINHSIVSAYALQSNKLVTQVRKLEQLKKYNLAINRGNSLGKTLDGFIGSLEESKRRRLNTKKDIFKMILAGRKDYFFSTEPNFQPTLNEYQETLPKLRHAKFKKIYTHQRRVPVYIVFTKKGNVYRDMNPLWLKTLEHYQDSVNIQERIKYHTAKAKNATRVKN